MPKREICQLHKKPLPCKACAGAAGGRVSSPKKSAANRAKSRFAAIARWYGREAAERIVDGR